MREVLKLASSLFLLVPLVSCATSGTQTAPRAAVSAIGAPEVTVEAGDGQVWLKWRAVPGAESYTLYMSLTPGASKRNYDGEKGSIAPSSIWSGLTNGTPYYFAVTAMGSTGESDDSNEVMAIPKPVSGASPKKPAEAPRTSAKIPVEPAKPTPAAGSPEAAQPLQAPRQPVAAVVPSETTRAVPPFEKTVTAVAPLPKAPEVVKAPQKAAGPEAPPPAPAKATSPPARAAATETAKPSPKTAPEQSPATAVASVPKTVAEPSARITSKLSPQELLTIADEIRAPGQNFVQDVKITYKKGSTESVNRLVTRVKGFAKSLAIFKEPATQKDQVMLMVENNMWVYFPNTKKPMRISPAQQMLGQVSNADVARVIYGIDYKAESVEVETIDSMRMLKLHLTAKTDGAAYGSINLWMKEESQRLYKAEFFALSGRILKTVYYKGYKQMLGRERPTIHEIHDALNTSEMSTMEYLSMKVEDTPDNYFQPTFMNRVAGL